MNRDRVEIIWNQQVERAVRHWKNMMNIEIAAIAGKHKQFAGILQRNYGAAKEGVKRQVDAFKTIMVQLKNPVGS